MKRPRITVLGGGTGTFTVLSGLKHHPVDLTAVVSMSDNGGSSGILRDELGVLPPGDIRQCLVALSEDAMLRDLFTYRFAEGALSGHAVGNIFLSALEKMAGDPLVGIANAHRILRVNGRVIPVTARASNLYAELEDGSVVSGEHAIDEPDGKRAPIRRCVLRPSVRANPEAIASILASDLIVIGPGDLYTSIIPTLLVDGITDALARTKAKRAYLVNLACKTGQTEGYPASKHLAVIEKYLAPATLDYVIVNATKPADVIADRYRASGEPLVTNDIANDPRVIPAPLLADTIIEQMPSDRLRRSLLRHDPEKLATAILALVT